MGVRLRVWDLLIKPVPLRELCRSILALAALTRASDTPSRAAERSVPLPAFEPRERQKTQPAIASPREFRRPDRARSCRGDLPVESVAVLPHVSAGTWRELRPVSAGISDGARVRAACASWGTSKGSGVFGRLQRPFVLHPHFSAAVRRLPKRVSGGRADVAFDGGIDVERISLLKGAYHSAADLISKKGSSIPSTPRERPRGYQRDAQCPSNEHVRGASGRRVRPFRLPQQHEKPTVTANAADIRSIAKDAYIYGTPMVDDYAVIYAYFPRQRRPAIQGPVQHDPQHRARLHPRRHRLRHAQLRHAVLVRGPRSARRAGRHHVPTMETKRYFVFQLMDLYTFNFAYIGSRDHRQRRRQLPDRRAGLEGETPQRHHAGDPHRDRLRHRRRPHAALQPGRSRQRQEDPGRLQGAAAVGLPWRAAPPPAPRRSTGSKPMPPAERTHVARILQSARVPAPVRAPPHPSETALRERFAKIGIVPGKPFDAAALSPEQKAALSRAWRTGRRQIDARARHARRQDRHAVRRPRVPEERLRRARDGHAGRASAPIRARRRCIRSTRRTLTASRSTAAGTATRCVRRRATCRR